MRRLMIALVAVAMVSPGALAQRTQAPPEPSEKQKAAIIDKRAREKEIDDAYKAAVKQMPDKQQKADPWGNLRAPSGQ